MIFFAGRELLELARRIERNQSQLLERMNSVAINLNDLTTNVDLAITALQNGTANGAALAQAQADLAAAQTSIDALTQKLKDALAAANPLAAA